ncbi:zinc finger MYM-type protein 1-like [Acipenser ruthenus]|uniref:zinc finger MYM-type protein 1-like n=1 Tax=Acipenser ruthenus TaxID=7906 RepID=UPI00274232D3|nr:zinc finger MYM-type protein 1-like [Acipenser ruthenus]
MFNWMSRKRSDTIHHNEHVRKNREVLKRLIDSVVYLGKQELAFRGRDEGTNSSNRGNYVELLPLISVCDSMLSNHLSISTVFSGTSNKIQNGLISSVPQVLLDAEVQEGSQRSRRTGGCSQRASTYPRARPSSHSTTLHSARTTSPGEEEHIFVHRGLWLSECLFIFVCLSLDPGVF